MKEVYLVDYRRTAFGKYGGMLSGFRPDDLAAHSIRDLLQRHPEIAPSEIDDVILGCANQAGEDNRDIARFAALLAGLPVEVPGVTVNRLCASGMQAIMDAYSRIASGLADIIVAGGVESMSRAPYVMAKASSPFERGMELYDTTLGWRFVNPAFEALYHPYSMGETAENVAERFQVSREAQDAFALASHQKYMAAWKSGIFEPEMIALPGGKHAEAIPMRDQAAREDTSLEKLAKLKTVFRDPGTVTAGNASGLNDGAAVVLVVSEAILKRYQLQPLARLVSGAVAGVHPDIMGTGPVPATQKVLHRAGLRLSDIDLLEINEAYASQVIYSMNALELNPDKVNINGGAIAIGHPLGASGARITGHLAMELQRRKQRYGIATMCVGVGQGAALLIENLNY